MRYIEVDLQEIAKDCLTRFNHKTLQTKQSIDKAISKTTIRLKEIFEILSGFAFKSEDYENDGVKLVRISNVDNEKNEYVFLPEEYKEDYQKYLLQENDIIIGLTGDGRIKVDYIFENDNFLLNQRVGALRIKNYDFNNTFLYYLLKHSKLVADQFLYHSNGKTQLNISPTDLLQIKIPQLALSTQNEAVAKIEPIEQQIKELKSKIIDQKQIINEVFAREFGFDLEKFEELKKEKMFFVGLQDFSNNQDVRFSSKFHRPSAKFVYDELKKITNTKIKDFLSEPIVLGSGISPADFYESGEIKYLGMSNIKNWYVDNESMQFVSSDFANRNKVKRTEINDIILARSGEGTIGKVALVENDCEAIFADFTMRIRFDNEKLNAIFAYYYFRTEYFQYLVEVNKKGLGNNTNIFPSQICEFPIPNLPLPHQQKIVDEIKIKIDKQNEIKEQIETMRGKIDEIINEVVESVS